MTATPAPGPRGDGPAPGAGTARLARIVRHPIKAIGHEELDSVVLGAGRPLPFDRHWAVAHAAARLTGLGPAVEWAPKVNFLRGVAGPELMAISAEMDELTGRITLSHPAAGTMTVAPGSDDDTRLLAWLHRLWPDSRPAPDRVVAAGAQPLSDQKEPFVSILGTGSLRDLGRRMGRELSPHRFRGNLWIDGWAPMAELDMVGRRVRIGETEIEIRARIGRCKATEVDPETGRPDGETLAALEAGWGHQDFGVFGMVIRGGEIATGDPVVIG